MTKKSEKDQIKKILEKIFSKEDKVSFYFLKKSKVNSAEQYKIPYKTKTDISQNKIIQANKNLEDFSFELVRWSELIGKLVPLSRVYKNPFFDSRDIEIKNPWRICPIGEHWVRRHPKNLKSGTKTDHDGHCRKNPSGKDLLKGDEIDLITQHELFKNPKVKVSSHNLGFKEAGNKYDNLISGWTAYWNEIFKLENPLHPNYVKALIATESSFLPESHATNPDKKIGKARGLVQLTEETYRLLKSSSRELKNHHVELDENELWEANKNLCASIRWLFRKREIAKHALKREPTWEEVLWDYKGRLKSKTAETVRVKADIKKYLGQLNAM